MSFLPVFQLLASISFTAFPFWRARRCRPKLYEVPRDIQVRRQLRRSPVHPPARSTAWWMSSELEGLRGRGQHKLLAPGSCPSGVTPLRSRFIKWWQTGSWHSGGFETPSRRKQNNQKHSYDVRLQPAKAQPRAITAWPTCSGLSHPADRPPRRQTASLIAGQARIGI